MHQTGTGVDASQTETIRWGFKGVIGEIRQGDDNERKAISVWETRFESAYDEALDPETESADPADRDTQG